MEWMADPVPDGEDFRDPHSKYYDPERAEYEAYRAEQDYISQYWQEQWPLEEGKEPARDYAALVGETCSMVHFPNAKVIVTGIEYSSDWGHYVYSVMHLDDCFPRAAKGQETWQHFEEIVEIEEW